MGMKTSPFYITFFSYTVPEVEYILSYSCREQSSPHPFFRSLTKNNLKLDMTFGIVYTTKHDITNRLVNRWTFPPLITIQYIRWMRNWQAFQMDGVNCRAYKLSRNSAIPQAILNIILKRPHISVRINILQKIWNQYQWTMYSWILRSSLKNRIFLC